jgi:hypothetical protein
MKSECISCIFFSYICSSLASFSHLGPSGLVFWKLVDGKVNLCNNPCDVAIPPTYCPPIFFQHRLHFTSASSLMSILSYFHSYFTPLVVLENEYTKCHSTTQHMQWLLFPLTVAAPLTWLLLP